MQWIWHMHVMKKLDKEIFCNHLSDFSCSLKTSFFVPLGCAIRDAEVGFITLVSLRITDRDTQLQRMDIRRDQRVDIFIFALPKVFNYPCCFGSRWNLPPCQAQNKIFSPAKRLFTDTGIECL